MKLQKEYTELRDKEASYWKQKSNEKWIQDGDRNTKSFHLTTMVRRRMNKIDGLFDDDGNWCENPMELKAIVVSHLQSLFFAHEELDNWFLIPLLFPRLDVNSLRRLDTVVKPEEVKNALFHIGSLKALGFDCFPAHFFQTH